MKKIISIFLSCIMILSCLSIVAFAQSTTLYRDGIFEFYISADNHAHITNITASDSTEISIPFRVCYDAEKIIGSININSVANRGTATINGFGDDDNDVPDYFGSNYAYVTDVEADAFHNYETTLTEVTFPMFLENIDLDSLRIDSLQSITVTEGNTNYKSSNGSLYNGNGTVLLLHPIACADATILPTVTEFAPSAFSFNTAITAVEIPAGVTVIPERCFENCSALTSVDFSDSAVVEIEPHAFENCALTSVTFPASIKNIDYNAFYGNSSMTAFTIPVGAKNVVIGASAFMSCPIGEITIYRSVAQIGSHAIGYYYDEDINLKQYSDCIINSYKFDQNRENTTALYDYAQEHSVKFIPLESDVYGIYAKFSQANEKTAIMYVYQNKTKKAEVISENGEFLIEDLPLGTYTLYFATRFGLIIKGTTVTMSQTDYKETYNVQILKYEPMGDVDNNGRINIEDIRLLLLDENYGSNKTDYDLDRDGAIGISDISIILSKYNYSKSSATLPNGQETPIIPL